MKMSRLGKVSVAAIAMMMSALPLQAQASGIPNAPVIAQLGPLSTAAINLVFQAPDSGGDTITSYDIWTSDDHGLTYNFHGTGTPNGSSSTLRFGLAASPAIARFVKVRARTATTEGSWSQPVEMFTTGARPMRVYIQAPDGTPIIGGAVTWNMPQTPAGGTAHSSVTYGLSTEGFIDLPQAPAGEATFTLTNGQLPNGVLVSGTFGAVLGYPSTVLQTVRPPSALHVISVEMPNGLPIANAHIDVNSSDMTDTQTRQGFTFSLPDSGLLSATPDFGPVVSPSPTPTASETSTPTPSPSGTPTPTPTVTVTVTATPIPTPSQTDSSSDADQSDWGNDVIDPANYSDDYWDYSQFDYSWADWNYSLRMRRSLTAPVPQHGVTGNVVVDGAVVASGTTNAMGRFVVKGFTNTVPTATITYDDGVIAQSQTVQLQAPLTRVELSYAPFISAGAPVYDSTLTTAAIIPVAVAEIVEAQKFSAVNTGGTKAHVLPQRARFKVVAPPGKQTAKCPKTASSFATSSTGKARIHVCASVSGNYLIKSLTPGVQSLGAVLIRVKGAPPMPIRKLVGTSKTPGGLSLRWSAPQYTGGANITGYRIVIKKAGKISQTQMTTRAHVVLTGLSHASRYEISVTALTKNGSSAPVSVLVPVV